MARYRRRMFTLAKIVIFSALSSCGSNQEAPNPVASPSEPPAEPTTEAFVHVLAAGGITTYGVVPATGLLSLVSTQLIPGLSTDANAFLAADPGGRFVYVDFVAPAPEGGGATAGGSRHLLRAYLVDRSTGTLTLASQRRTLPPIAMVATRKALLLSYSDFHPSGSATLLETFVPDENGVLRLLGTTGEGGPYMFTDPKRDRLFWSDLDVFVACGVEVTPWAVRTSRQFFVDAPDDDRPFRDGLVMGDVIVAASSQGRITAFVPPAEGELSAEVGGRAQGPADARLAASPDVLAVAGRDGDGEVVQTYSVGSAGRLTALRKTALSLDAFHFMAFHPSGRFLYVTSSTLHTFVVESDGSLRPFGNEMPGSGRVVVTAPNP